MDTIVKYLYDTGYQGWAIILAVFLIFIEFNPKIKFNPIAKFLGWVGSKFNSSVKTQIEEYMKTINADMLTTKEEINLLKKNLEEVSTNLQKDELGAIYWEISCFETSLINGEKYYREQYRQIIEKGNKYKNLVSILNLSREDAHLSEIEESIELISKHYNDHRTDQEIMI
jgi:hypothetical protein